jgi:hypothetical protein
VGVELLTERHAGQIAGVLGCWDRMLVFGTLPKICFAGGMTSFLYERKIQIFDYPMTYARTVSLSTVETTKRPISDCPELAWKCAKL